MVAETDFTKNAYRTLQFHECESQKKDMSQRKFWGICLENKENLKALKSVKQFLIRKKKQKNKTIYLVFSNYFKYRRDKKNVSDGA